MRYLAILALPLALLATGCGNTQQAPSFATFQALTAAADAAIDVERGNIIAALPPAQQPAAQTAIDAFDAGAAGIAAVDPTKSTAAQATAAVNAFLGAAAPLVSDLPLKDSVKAEITVGIAAARAVLPFIPAMFPVVVAPPAPAPTPAPTPAPAPAPAPGKPVA